MHFGMPSYMVDIYNWLFLFGNPFLGYCYLSRRDKTISNGFSNGNYLIPLNVCLFCIILKGKFAERYSVLTAS